MKTNIMVVRLRKTPKITQGVNNWPSEMSASNS
jgi:hypothetical protein